MVKEILKKILSMTKALSTCVVLASFTWGCGADPTGELISGQVMALYGLQGRWAGTVVPSESGCGQTGQGLMSIGKNGFGFDPFQSTSVIRGEVAEDGHMRGRLVRQGPDRRELSLEFEADLRTPDEIGGILRSGRCRWTVTLHRG